MLSQIPDINQIFISFQFFLMFHFEPVKSVIVHSCNSELLSRNIFAQRTHSSFLYSCWQADAAAELSDDELECPPGVAGNDEEE